MFSAIVLCLFFTSAFAIKVDVDTREPFYNYRKTEELKTSASDYHPQNYNPQYHTNFNGGFQGGYGGKWNGPVGANGYGPIGTNGYGPIGANGYGPHGGVGPVGGYGHVGGYGYGPGYGGYAAGGYGGFNPGFVGGYAPFIGGNFRPQFYPNQHGHGQGGGYVDKKNFVDENKKAGGESFEKAEGSKGESGQHGEQGYKQGQVAVKNINGGSGYYNNQAGDKKGYTDGKSYQGGEQYSQIGGKGEGDNQKANHRKGHSKKGFKSTHHKDETGSEETFYDEAHDEGDSFRYGSNEGKFGTKGESSYKGGQENGQYLTDEKRKQGHFEQQQIVDNSNADKGQYGQKGYHGNSQGYSVNNGAGQQSLLGRQEANRLYYNHHPHGYVPIFDDSY